MSGASELSCRGCRSPERARSSTSRRPPGSARQQGCRTTPSPRRQSSHFPGSWPISTPSTAFAATRLRPARRRPRHGSTKGVWQTSRRRPLIRRVYKYSRPSEQVVRSAVSQSPAKSPLSLHFSVRSAPPTSPAPRGVQMVEPSRSSSSLESMPELAGKVADAFEAQVREQEERSLSSLAVRSYETRGRLRPEDDCRLRTPFQRDRDRILHSKPFRRLKGKTQVFIDPAGDHYRTRMTHTLETTGIARGVARALRLNEDLVEAIGLGHDMGHPPFGHAGEEALDAALQERFGRRFRHNEQSLRIAESLNLTEEVRDGILTPTGSKAPASLEGKIVRIVDRVAYINHDIDDAVRFGILDPAELPREEVALLGDRGSRRIDTLVHDLVETSERAGDIVQSEEIGEAMLALRTFMFERVYLGPQTRTEQERARVTVRRIFEHLAERGDEPEQIIEFIAGMTDRFALDYVADL